MSDKLELTMGELRAIALYTEWCARPVLHVFERHIPDDPRPRLALDAAQSFSTGAKRSGALRDAAWAAERAARDADACGLPSAASSARAARAAAASAFLHPVPQASQLKHILGAAAHAALAFDLMPDEPCGSADRHIARSISGIPAIVVEVLTRYPPAPAGRGGVAAIIRRLDDAIRWTL